MQRSIRVLVVAFILAAAFWRSALAAEIKLDGHTFTLPDGFEIEQVAGPPLVDRPITCDFDEQGRLYVADSSGSNDKVEKQLAEKPHRIVRLEDTDGDGRFDKSVVFADKMMFPEGTMWLDGSLYVAAPPSIWKLTDTDGDGVADQREEWFAGKTLTGCANDLHGPYAGPDGWIYWCKGAFAKQTYSRDGKPEFVTRAAHIFRCRPDGTGIEAVMTGGMDNPVDLVFTPGGEIIFTTTFLQHPGGGKRDGLIHAVYGGVYGKVWEVIEDHPRTGDVLPPLAHLGAAAPCGLARYESDVFGGEYRDNLFACCFNMHKVTRHVLEPSGATFKSTDSDFLVSDNLDFHPTDVQEDADGSLIVVNTGGWYKLCCPTSQLHKPDILGAIYRVRKTNARRVDDPRGAKIPWAKLSPDELAWLLADARPVIQSMAIAEFAHRNGAAVGILAQIVGIHGRQSTIGGGHSAEEVAKREALEKKAEKSALMRRNAVWALTRIDDPNARDGVLRGSDAYDDPDETVCQAMVHSASLWRDKNAVKGLLIILAASSSPHKWRSAAQALGRICDGSTIGQQIVGDINYDGKSDVIPFLLDRSSRLDKTPDRFLEHSIIFALTEMAAPDAVAEGLQSKHAATRRVALIALDQMPNGGLKPEMVAELLGSNEPLIKETAAWIVGRHPEWGDALAGYLRSRLQLPTLTDADAAELEQQLAQFGKSAAVQEIMAHMLDDPNATVQAKAIVLGAMARAAVKEPPAAWIAALTKLLAGGRSELLEPAVAAAKALPPAKTPDSAFVQALMAIAGNKAAGAGVRLTALAAVPGGLTEVSSELFRFLRERLHPDVDVTERSSAADVLARSKLTPAQLTALADSFKTAGPLEADRLLPAYKDSADENMGLTLVAALKDSSALSGLRIDAIKAALAKFPASVQNQADGLYLLINADAARQKEKLESVLVSLQEKEGDIRRGQAVFNSTKAACAACHPFGYLGGNVGPDLTKIGGIRQERDLLESIIFPSASLARSFEPIVVATQSGKTINGLLKSETPDEIVLATGPNEIAHVARSDIEEVRPSSVSVMPSGLDQQLSTQDLADLIAFLKNAK
jgi:putative membrane-bound dehydrogenase-like protein